MGLMFFQAKFILALSGSFGKSHYIYAGLGALLKIFINR